MANSIIAKYIRTKVSKGRRYTYFEHPAIGRKRILAKPKTSAFLLEIAQLTAEAGGAPQHRKISRRSPHGSATWGGLVAAYLASPEYAQLAPRTKQDYEKVLDWLADLNSAGLSQFTSAECLNIRDRAFAQKKWRFANYVVHMLSAVFAWGMPPRNYTSTNPALGLKIKASKNAPEANRPWTVEECRIVIEQAQGTLGVAIALAMFASMRGGDIIKAEWSIYNGKAIQWDQGKTGEGVWKPARRMLREILDAAPRRGPRIVTGPTGVAWSAVHLRKEFRTLIARLEREGRVGYGLTLHGLRTTNATRIADAGGDVRMIQAELGQRTAAMGLHYSRNADMKRAADAAVHILYNEHQEQKVKTQRSLPKSENCQLKKAL
jgi:integrase